MIKPQHRSAAIKINQTYSSNPKTSPESQEVIPICRHDGRALNKEEEIRLNKVHGEYIKKNIIKFQIVSNRIESNRIDRSKRMKINQTYCIEPTRIEQIELNFRL
jgi:hypothetical protein